MFLNTEWMLICECGRRYVNEFMVVISGWPILVFWQPMPISWKVGWPMAYIYIYIYIQGSRLRLKRSHLRPKILICEWSFCWGRHWRLYIFTCYDIKISMQGLFSWLFCDHIFCFVHVLNLKLKDDTHQSFSGKEFQTVLVSAAQQRWRTQSAKHSSVVQRERDWNDGDLQVQKRRVYFVHNLNKLQQVKLSALWILAILSTILIYNHY